MKRLAPLSPADSAFERFRALLPELRALDGTDWSEADTRSKLIDPLFRDVLGWPELEIIREEPAGEGLADYRFGRTNALFHVEAKRTLPRFQLHVPSGVRLLSLSGPHLLGNRHVVGAIKQAQKYGADLGSAVAVLTNGAQFVVFRTHIVGQPWKNGKALVFHGLDDIEANFAEFFELLDHAQVQAGALARALAEADETTVNLYQPSTFVHAYDAELVRNPFWHKISGVLGPILEPTAADVQLEILEHCYVATPLSDETDRTIDALLRDAPRSFLIDAGTVNLTLSSANRTAFARYVEEDVKGRSGGTYLLTGGVGSGKTTFLRRFELVVARQFVDEWCVWIHIDYISMGAVDTAQVHQALSAFTTRRAREIVKSRYNWLEPKDGAEMRDLFKEEIADAERTRLYGLEGESRQQQINALVEGLYRSDDTFLSVVLRKARSAGKRIVVVFDNTDQLGEVFQESVFLLSQKLTVDWDAICIVALREEKFFAAYRRGLFDAFGDKRRFHIGSPSLKEVLRRRLKYALSKLRENADTQNGSERNDTLQAVQVVDALIRSTTAKNQNIVRYLSCVSNGDMRYALGAFRDFVSSGNTDTGKILRKIADSGGYTVPFHEFAKSAILGTRRYYRSGSSSVVNVFLRSSSSHSSLLTGVRCLARLSSATGAVGGHGEGYVGTAQLLQEFSGAFGRVDDLVARADDLLSRGLLESEPPRAQTLTQTEAVRVSASGAYYWRYLVRSFAYVDLMLLDTPLPSREVAQRLAGTASLTDMESRFIRVRLFLDQLAQEESADIAHLQTQGGPFSRSLITEIRDQIEHEIREIARKVGVPADA